MCPWMEIPQQFWATYFNIQPPPRGVSLCSDAFNQHDLGVQKRHQALGRVETTNSLTLSFCSSLGCVWERLAR